MALPWTDHLEGVDGTALTGPNVGADSVAGTGTAVYVDNGLLPGSVSRAHIEGQRGVRHIITGSPTVVRTTIFIKQFDGDRPVGDDAIIMRYFDAADANLAGWGFTEDFGKVYLLAGEDPHGDRVETDHGFCDGNKWLVKHKDDRVAGRQWVWVYNENGKLRERKTATVRAGTYDKAEYGITNTGPTFQLDVDECLGSTGELYFFPWFDLARIGGATSDRMEVVVRVQGGARARLTTSGSTFRVSDPVTLTSEGYGKFVVEDLPVPDAVYTHTIEVEKPNGAWVGVGDPITTRTQSAVTA